MVLAFEPVIQGHELSGAGLVIDITGFDATVERRDIAADDRLHPIWGDHLWRVRLRRLSVYAVGGWQLTVARQRPTSCPPPPTGYGHGVDIDVRPCVAAEVAVLAGREPPGRGFAVQAFANQDTGRSTFLVAWHDQSPCGSCEVTRSAQPELLNLNVAEACRGRGVGTALIRAAESVAAAAGELVIGVATDNPAARRLYERLGYRATGGHRETTYTYVDDDNHEHTVTELDETLRKVWVPW